MKEKTEILDRAILANYNIWLEDDHRVTLWHVFEI